MNTSHCYSLFNHIIRRCTAALLATAFGLGLTASTHGAVTYLQVTFSSDADASLVLNTGTFVVANALGNGPQSTTINGVPFDTSQANLGNFANGGGDFSTQFSSGGALDKLFTALVFTPNTDPGTLTLTGLTPGASYRVQLLFCNQVNNTGVPQRVQIQGENFDTGDYGSSAIAVRAEFVASGTSEVVNLLNLGNRTVMNGYVLHSLAPSPEIQVSGNGTVIADGDTTPTTMDHTGFGVPAGTRTYTIANAGSLDLHITNITVSGANAADFTVGTLTPASPIAAGGSATFTVTFTPGAAGARTASIAIENDDSDENPYNFDINGGVFDPTLTTLVNFNYNGNGGYPRSGLVLGTDGNFYGMTENGGNNGYGTAFMVTPAGVLTTLVHFNYSGNGGNPYGALMQGSDGNLYGMTQTGGNNGYGTVFKMTLGGTLTTLASFNGSNGRYPRGSLVEGADGNFYGMANQGGNYGNGTAFKVTPGGTITTLASFNYYSTGGYPVGSLVLGADGDFYGMTADGGSSGQGTAFKMTPGGTLTTLVHFNSGIGTYPQGGFVQGSDGDFYGTTYQGGSGGNGTAFKMTSAGVLTTLVNFNGGNGSYPYGSLVQATDGDFYGMAQQGGNNGYGTVFKMTPSGTLTTLANFNNSNGSYPYGGLVQAMDGDFYGTTSTGGSSGYGTVFRLSAGAPPFSTAEIGVHNGADNGSPELTDGQSSVVSFGNTTTGTPVSHSFTVTNSGVDSLVISGIGLPAGFALAGSPTFPQSITSGTMWTFQAEFTAASAGNFTGSLNITNSDHNERIFNFPVSADAFDPGTTPEIAVFNGADNSAPELADGQATAVNFGQSLAAPGTPSVVRSFTVTNSGTAHLTVSGISLPSTYSLVGVTLPQVIGIGASWTFQVALTGVVSGVVSIANTDADENPFDFPVTGTVITPALTTLVNFDNSNGSYPNGDLVLGSDGDFYGMTQSGGSSGSGTAFKVTLGGVLTTLVNFNYSNGSNPRGSLIQTADGNFYGMTESGGNNGNGTAFKMTPAGVLTTLVHFNYSNGSNPRGNLVLGADGNFYGMAQSGGNNGYGTVFKMTPAGTLTTLVNFNYSGNGGYPYGSLVLGSDGDFYGMTRQGGNNGQGTVFKMTPAGTLTTLVNFNGGNGGYPRGSLVQGEDGDFYGMTESGGSNGSGIVFKMTPAGTLTTLVNFNYGNGAYPQGSLVRANDGDFYGLTYYSSPGSGTAFKLTPAGTLTTLVYLNTSGGGSGYSAGSLVQGVDGNLYGMSESGGTGNSGTLFRLYVGAPPFSTAEIAVHNRADNSAPELTDGQASAVSFGNTTTGTPVTRSFTVTNSGVDSLVISAIQLPAGFALLGSPAFPQNVPSGTMWTFQVEFSAASAGNFSGSLNITNSDFNEKVFNFVISADAFDPGTAPEIAVHNGADNSAPELTDGQAAVVDFGESLAVPGAPPTLRSFTVTNSGTAHLTVSGISLPTGFSVVGVTFPQVVGAGASWTFQVALSAVASGSLSIASTDADENPFDFPVAGTAIIPVFTKLLDFNYYYDSFSYPLGSLVQGDDGDFYGMTPGGYYYYYGTAFKMSASGTPTTLVNFNYSNGGKPNGSLVLGRDGNFYGMTYSGGNSGYGTAFKMTPAGSLTTLVGFNYSNGAYPYGNLVQAADGDFYGMTQQGGSSGYGTAFKMTPDGTLTTLVNFDYSNGGYPRGSLVQGADGDFYGMTYQGGNSGQGTVFKMTAGGALTTLVNFDNSNGAYPRGSLVQGADGDFYGMTENGGNSGYGTVFKMTPTGTLTTLVNFNGGNGSYPYGSLIQASDGAFYGMTRYGGTAGNGTVFKMTPAGVLTTVVHLDSSTGYNPEGGLVQAYDGTFYGLTQQGGNNGGGTAFQLYVGAPGIPEIAVRNGPDISAPNIADGQAAAVTFGTTPVGTDLTRTYTITNLGAATLTISGITASAGFTVLNAPMSVAALSAATFQVRMDGGTLGTFTGTITIGNNDPNENPFSFDLVGVVATPFPEIGVHKGGDNSAPALADGQTTVVQLGNTFTGFAPVTNHFTITNAGGASLTISGITAPAGYTLENVPTVLGPGGMATFQAILLTTADGVFAGSIAITSDDADEGVFDFPVYGKVNVLQFTTIANLDYSGPQNPQYGALVQGGDGDFYGMSYSGGNNGYGTVFKVTSAGVVTTLVVFNYSNGGYPYGSLVQGSDGNFYGMTREGGNNGYGTAFKMTPTGTLTTLVNFNYSNGANPYGRLVQGGDGNFYGMTYQGGNIGYGTAFKMTPGGTLTTLVNFGYSNGAYPYGSLVQGSDGDFYGMTQSGGNNGNGTAFKMTPGGALTTLVHFNNNSGRYPQGSLMQGSDGNFYGMTTSGGSFGSGTAFKMTPGGALTTLVNFDYSNGAYPIGSLVQASDGDFYGMTQSGGSSGSGTIFKMTAGGELATLVNFDYYGNGAYPYGSLMQAFNGDLYGMTSQGGNNGQGTIFRLSVGAPGIPEIAVFNGSDSSAPPIGDGQAVPVNFGATTVGADLTRDFAITNLGAATLTISGITAPAGFTVLNAPSSVAAGAMAVFQLRFNATALGGFSGSVVIGNNDPNENPFNFNVVALVATPFPEIGVHSGADTSAPMLVDGQAAAVLFGSVFTGQPVTNQFTITNSGAATLNISGITAPAGYTVLNAPASVVGAGVATFQVVLDAAAAGVFASSVEISSDDADENPFSFPVYGKVSTLAFAVINHLDYSGGPRNPYYGHLVQGADGDLYGMSYSGGNNSYGTVFKVTSAGVVTTLVDFNYGNGAYPYGSLVLGGDGDFYGITRQGGNNGYGTVFKMTPGGVLTTLVNLDYSSGRYPYGSLVQGSDGDFYGMTYEGGNSGYGTAFKMTPTGSLTTLVNFNYSNGGYPRGSLVQGTDGDFYGMTENGGNSGAGTAFKMTAAGVLTTLVHFDNGSNGGYPGGSLVQGSDGNFYGMTRQGGNNGYGAAFKMTPTGSLTTLVSFNYSTGGSPYGSLVQATDGNFYGMTYQGGNNGYGTIFKMTPSGELTTLVNFDYSNGRYPQGSLMQASNGILYGMTESGGNNGQGTLFSLDVGAPASGGAGAPEIALLGNGVEIPDGSATTSTADGTDFGSVNVSGGAVTHTFTITNSGTGPLTIYLGGGVAGDFTVSAITPSGPIAASGTATFTVTFDPSVADVRTATVTLISDDADESFYDFAVTGTGTGGGVTVNQAPTLNAVGSITINEDAGVQTVLLAGITSGSISESQTLTITAASSSTGLIATPIITYTSPNTTASLSFTPQPDANGVATLTVIVTDDGGTSGGGIDAVTNTFAVVVTPVNDAPIQISLSGTNAAENAASGATVGTFSATDPDAGDTAAFTLVTGTGDTDNASFSITDGALQTAAVFDYEAKNSYRIRVRATDGGGLYFERQFDLAILDAPEATNQISEAIEDAGAQHITLNGNGAGSIGFQLVTNAGHGLVSVSGSVATYTPINNYQGLDTFSYVVTNASGSSSVATVTVTVVNVSDFLPFAFSNAVNVAVGGAPVAVVAGDFNRHYTDLAVANYSSNTVSIFMGTGMGGFTSAVPATVSVGNGPVALVAADFHRDSRTDLAVVNKNDNTLQVFKGNHNGTFTLQSLVPVGNLPSSVAAGSINKNKDQFFDLVVASSQDNAVRVLLNNGAGGFGAGTNFSVGAQPEAVVLADFNKDLKIDIATANYAENTVSILWGGGTGIFSNHVRHAVGENHTALAAGDFNKDGRVDLVVVNYGDDTISVLLSVRETNSGVRTNTFTRTDYPVGLQPSAVVVTNLNKDAWQDIIVASYYEHTVQVLLGRTNGAFEYFYNDPSATESVGTNPIALAVGNFNADTDLDVAVANWGSGNLSILLNNYTPVAYGQKVNVIEDTATPITLTATYGPLNYLIVSGPTNGSFTLTNGAMSNTVNSPVLTYLPDENANGKDLITFQVQDDGGKLSKVVKIEIAILPVNDAPSFNLASNAVELAEDSPKRSITNFAVDLDRGGSGHATEAKQMLYFVVTNGASNLFKTQPAIDPAGRLTFEPAKNAHGEATVGVILKDKSGTANGGVDTSAQAFFTLTITNVNDTPVLFNWPAAFPPVKTNSSTNITFAVWDNDTGTNGLYYSVNWTNTALFADAANKGNLTAFASTNFAFGTVGTNRTLTIYPAFGQKGTDRLIVTIYDGTNSISKTNAVTVK
ncbi:MAG: choice-of-anchor D domain-containing protein [Verrucomicrobia bacterium]|nr:choice-of-anchor D domain-containing protein [Verrucomicrobiota bacterium]